MRQAIPHNIASGGILRITPAKREPIKIAETKAAAK